MSKYSFAAMNAFLKSQKRNAFTLVEILIVVVILSIAAVTAIPLMSSASSVQIRSAANLLTSDLEYAKSLAIGTGRKYSVVFNTSTETYQIEDQNGTVIDHPIRKGQKYIVQFAANSRLDKVQIESANFDGTSTITFDYLGSPYNGNSEPLNNGSVTIEADTMTINIAVESLTGYVTIN